MVPLIVPRTQVRRVRLRHLATTLAKPLVLPVLGAEAFTTALQLIASASAPPSLVSQVLARLAAGAT